MLFLLITDRYVHRLATTSYTVDKMLNSIQYVLFHFFTYTKFAYNRLDLGFSIPKVALRSPFFQPMQKFLMLVAAYYLQIYCFQAKTCKLICLYPGCQAGVISVQPLPCQWHYVHVFLRIQIHGPYVTVIQDLLWLRYVITVNCAQHSCFMAVILLHSPPQLYLLRHTLNRNSISTAFLQVIVDFPIF